MSDPAPALLAALQARLVGRRVWLVGGAVRDALLGRPVRDLDLVVTGDLPSLRAALGGWVDSLWLQGHDAATLGALKDGVRLELTALGDRDILTDLTRRDFTVNALARDLETGALLDPCGGAADAAARRLRCCGDPQDRFRDDPIRLLRACRLAAELGFTIAKDTEQALRADAARIGEAAVERAGDELEQLLCGPRPAEGLHLLADFGLLKHLAPELEDLRGLPQPPRYHALDAWEHTCVCVALVAAQPVLRWAALLHDIGKPKTFLENDAGIHFYDHEALGAEMAEAMLLRWARPRAVRARVTALVRDHMLLPQYRPEWTDTAVRRLVRRVGDQWDDLVALTTADQHAGRRGSEEFDARLRDLAARVAALGGVSALAVPLPLLSAAEVMAALDTEAGPLVGRAMRFLAAEREAGRLTSPDAARAALRRRFGGGRVAPPEAGG